MNVGRLNPGKLRFTFEQMNNVLLNTVFVEKKEGKKKRMNE